MDNLRDYATNDAERGKEPWLWTKVRHVYNQQIYPAITEYCKANKDAPKLLPVARLTFMFLVINYNHTKDECFIGGDELALEAGVDKNAIGRATDSLAEWGFITKKRRPNKSNLYTIVPLENLLEHLVQIGVFTPDTVPLPYGRRNARSERKAKEREERASKRANKSASKTPAPKREASTGKTPVRTPEIASLDGETIEEWRATFLRVAHRFADRIPALTEAEKGPKFDREWSRAFDKILGKVRGTRHENIEHLTDIIHIAFNHNKDFRKPHWVAVDAEQILAGEMGYYPNIDGRKNAGKCPEPWRKLPTHDEFGEPLVPTMPTERGYSNAECRWARDDREEQPDRNGQIHRGEPTEPGYSIREGLFRPRDDGEEAKPGIASLSANKLVDGEMFEPEAETPVSEHDEWEPELMSEEEERTIALMRAARAPVGAAFTPAASVSQPWTGNEPDPFAD